MWRCAHCKAAVPHGTTCPECGRPIDEALSEISRKVRRIYLRGNVPDRWMWRGAKTGFIVGVLLWLLMMAAMLVVGLVTDRNLTELLEALGIMLPFVLVFAISLALVFAVIFLVFGAVIKPIWVALFCRIERFEQEYGSTNQ